jgi:predicted porin
VKKRLFTFLGSIFFLTQLVAQEKDFGLWTQVSLEKKFTPRFSVQIREALRLDENASRIAVHYTQAIISYKLTNSFGLNVAYRNSQKFKFDETISYRSRFQVDLVYKTKLKNLELEIQERIQTQFSDINRNADWKTPKNTLRSRFTLSYDLGKRITPFFYYELFYHINNDFDNQRFRLGLDYEINKKQGMTLFYMLDQEIRVNNPLSTYALGVSYKYAF